RRKTMIFQVKELLSRIGLRQEKGQGLIEYALIILLIAIVVIAALTFLGPQIAAVYDSITTALGGAPAP
ncbi:MAG: Flp family type IVb pilin, partial [Chloroflexota bacterium]